MEGPRIEVAAVAGVGGAWAARWATGSSFLGRAGGGRVAGLSPGSLDWECGGSRQFASGELQHRWEGTQAQSRGRSCLSQPPASLGGHPGPAHPSLPAAWSSLLPPPTSMSEACFPRLSSGALGPAGDSRPRECCPSPVCLLAWQLPRARPGVPGGLAPPEVGSPK